jgi:hypothetical protein
VKASPWRGKHPFLLLYALYGEPPEMFELNPRPVRYQDVVSQPPVPKSTPPESDDEEFTNAMLRHGFKSTLDTFERVKTDPKKTEF